VDFFDYRPGFFALGVRVNHSFTRLEGRKGGGDGGLGMGGGVCGGER